ncbi:MAG: NADH-quinone oxidoreductase subunit NuoH [Gemmatales bacterium]|nr:NADH-quinone oxidoreductase subunit NuoH [Gemmatales bacterium]MDW8385532.1 NADH-quinone oxidoreductase subunit NuoH [Gemmatales bacterium]
MDWLADYWPVIRALLASILLVTLVAGSAIIFIWMERKVAGRIQDRLGPTRVGGKFGWLQTIADGIKLIAKEDIIPAHADQLLFRISPYIAFVGVFLSFLVLPFGREIVGLPMNIAAFFMLSVLSTEVFGIILAGYGSGSKWSLFGGMREAAQMVSYEVPRALCVVIPVLAAGTLDLQLIAQQQAGFFWNWLIFHDPFQFLTFWVFFTVATAGCKRAPFDLAEAESELVAGFHTEYSGFRWCLFFMAEYGAMFAASALAVTLFLGGWHTGLFPADFMPGDFETPLGILASFLSVIVLIAKSWLLVFVMMWIRWTLPRLRIDQVMMMCLKYLVPISCALLLLASLLPLLWNTLGLPRLPFRNPPALPVLPATQRMPTSQAMQPAFDDGTQSSTQPPQLTRRDSHELR